MMAPNKQHKHRLIVEGRDDVYAIIGLLERHGHSFEVGNESSIPYVHDSKGIEPLFKSLPIAAKTYNRLGVVLDADLSLSDRWTAVRNNLSAVNVMLPVTPDKDGTVVEGIKEGWRVGVWAMPDNTSCGMLETFLAELVPQPNDCWDHAKEATKEAIELGAPLKSCHIDKGEIHSWLAWQEDPGMPFGTAFSACVFKKDGDAADRFVKWFGKVFLD